MNKPAWQETVAGMIAILTWSTVTLRKAHVRINSIIRAIWVVFFTLLSLRPGEWGWEVGCGGKYSSKFYTGKLRPKVQPLTLEAIPKLRRELERVSDFNQSINWHHYMKDRVESSHLTKFDAFRVNRDRVIDLETWFKIHTNVSNHFDRKGTPFAIPLIETRYPFHRLS